MRRLIFGTIAGFVLTLYGQIALGACFNIQGSLQLWERGCGADRCGMPQPLSERFPVNLCLEPPESPGHVGWAKELFFAAGYQIDFEVLWKTPDSHGSIDRSYFAFQTSIAATGERLQRVAACSRYITKGDTISFPVGACTGFIERAGQQWQVGVTFFKE